MVIGVHVSIAGGVQNAPERGHRLGCEAIQVFTKSNLQWAASHLSNEQCARFRSQCAQFRLAPNMGHASYLLNLAAGDPLLYERSIRTLLLEYRRAEALGLCCLAVHPGAHRGGGVTAGITRVAEALRRVLDETPGFSAKLALETTSGAGTTLGSRFEELAQMIDLAGGGDRLGVCFDTCHVFASGYDLRGRGGCRATMEQLDRSVGFSRLCCFHLNDSRGALGSHTDRHAHIGHGALGEDVFACLLRDRRFRRLPAVLETPKEMKGKTHWDVVNLRTLRRLREGSPMRRRGHA